MSENSVAVQMSRQRPAVIMYAKAGCPYCVRAKRALRRHGIPFRAIPAVKRDGTVTPLPDGRTRYSVPQMYLPVGGYDAMDTWVTWYKGR